MVGRGAVGRVAARAFRRAACRSRSSRGGRGCVATRSGAALRSAAPPGYRRAPARRRSWIRSRTRSTGCCKDDPRLPGQRVRELIEPLGFDGGKTIVDDYLREVRPLFDAAAGRFSARSIGPGEICQFDLWEPRAEVPVGHGQTRRGWVVVACLGYSRAGAGALVFSKQTAGSVVRDRGAVCGRWAALPQTLVWDRQAGLHAGGGRPTEAFAAFCGAAAGRLAFLRAGAIRRPRASSSGCRTSPRRSFEPGRRVRERARLPAPARRLVRRAANARTHKTLRCRPIDRLARGARGDGAAARAAARHRSALGAAGRRRTRTCASTPTTTRSTRALVGRRVEVRVTEREVIAVALDTGELACRHAAVVRAAPHDHRARARPRAASAAPRAPRPREPVVEVRPLAALRRADRMTRPTPELAHLFRALKAPAAARALPKLADRARAEEWSYEQFAAALLKTEVDSRDSHGGQGRIKAARFPARKTLEEFDFAFQTLAQARHRRCTSASSTSSPARRTSSCSARPAPARPTSRSRSAIRACLAGHRVAFRTATEWVALLADAQRHGRLDDELARLQRDPAADRRRGRLHPVRPAGRQPDVHARLAAATNAPR